MITTVLNKKTQESLTPDAVLADLIEGNNRFINDKMHLRAYARQVEATVGGQFPKAVILSYIDSRVPVETVFDQGIGDIFVARVAGNFENTDILGSMEYSCKVAGSKLVLVIGHESYGAVKAACDGVELGNITALLKNIEPAVKLAATQIKCEINVSNADFVAKTVENNVKLTIERIREKSTILKTMEDKGEIKIVGAVYHLTTGKIVLL
ncbi:MAG: carbonic anhydrase family protein [Bacteroidota bacterium]